MVARSALLANRTVRVQRHQEETVQRPPQGTGCVLKSTSNCVNEDYTVLVAQFSIAYLIYMLLGLCVLYSWNAIVTSLDYLYQVRATVCGISQPSTVAPGVPNATCRSLFFHHLLPLQPRNAHLVHHFPTFIEKRGSRSHRLYMHPHCCAHADPGTMKLDYRTHCSAQTQKNMTS